jgi:hypothetical protein
VLAINILGLTNPFITNVFIVLAFSFNIVYTAFYAKENKHSYKKTFQDFAENTVGVLSE